MAEKKGGKRRYGKWTEEDLFRCLAAVRRGEGLNSSTKTFGVPKATLLRHMRKSNKWANNATKHFGRPTFLPHDIEEDLVKYILDLDRMLFGLSKQDLVKLAYEIADRNNLKHGFNTTKKAAGHDWYKGFLSRHPDICLRQPEATSIARAHGFNKPAVEKFFGYLENLIERYSLSATHIFNMDETGISTVHKPPRVLSQRGKSQVGSLTSGERGVTTTGVFCMSAAGQYVPPMLVFKRKRLNPQLEIGAPARTLITCSDSGWMTRETFLAYLRHFIKRVKPSIQDPVLLILDGHRSHTKNLEAIDLARQNGVVMLSLPPHTTHRLQPLDVSFFQPLKQAYNRAVTTWMRNSAGKAVTAYQVAHLLNESYCHAASIQNAVRGFEKCGIWPCKRDVFSDSDFVPLTSTSTSAEANTMATDVAAAPSFHPQAEEAPHTDTAADVGADLRQNTAIESQPTSRRSPEPFFAEGTYKVVYSNPDGRCLFRSIAIGLDRDLQQIKRDHNGCPEDSRLKTKEQLKADKLRAETIDFMMNHIDEYQGLESDVLNADQPQGTLKFKTIEDRLIAISSPTAMPGELELCALSRVLCVPVIVVDAQLKTVVKYNLDRFSGQNVLYVQYTTIRADVGHYNCVLFSPSPTQTMEPDDHSSHNRTASTLTSVCSPVNNSPSTSNYIREVDLPPSHYPTASHCDPSCDGFQADHDPQADRILANHCSLGSCLSARNSPSAHDGPPISGDERPISLPSTHSTAGDEYILQNDLQTPADQSLARQPVTSKRISHEDIAPLPKKSLGLFRRLRNRSDSAVITSSPYKSTLAAQVKKTTKAPKTPKASTSKCRSTLFPKRKTAKKKQSPGSFPSR